MSIVSQIQSLPPWMLLCTGAIFGWVKNFWNYLYNHTIGYAINKCKVTLYVEESDHISAYIWLNLWIEQQLQKKKIASLRLQKTMAGLNLGRKDSLTDKNYSIVPHYGTYFLRWKQKYVSFTAAKEQNQNTIIDSDRVIKNRSIEITVWMTRNRKVLFDILDEAKQLYETDNPDTIDYYRHVDGYWDTSTLSKRPLTSIYLPDELIKDVTDSIATFLKSKKTYIDLGIPWRLGFLFKGPPGTGKSSFIHAIASEFNLPVYNLNLNSTKSSTQLTNLLSELAKPCIVTIEDIDCINAAQSRGGDEDNSTINAIAPTLHVSGNGKIGKIYVPKKNNTSSELVLSDLLNALDGLGAAEHRIVIMTTNKPTQLDPALIRSGRIDKTYDITYATELEVKKFYDRCAEKFELPSWDEFKKTLPQTPTIADIQTIVFKYKIKDI